MSHITLLAQEIADVYVSHVNLLRTYDADVLVPKHHLFSHLIFGSRFFGPAGQYACFADESCSKELKATCRYIHQSHFEGSLLVRMAAQLEKRHLNGKNI